MLRNYLKIAFRNLWKNKGYSIINILGLTIGLTVCLLLFLFIRYERSFDDFNKNADRIYRIVSSWQYANSMEYSEGTPLPLPKAMRQDFPELKKVAAVASAGNLINIPGKDGTPPQKFNEKNKVFFVEPEFYEIFNFPWVIGKPEEALKQPNSVALTQSMATKYFGDWHKAMGKAIILNNNKQLTVTGIIKDLPDNTDFPFYVAVSYSTFQSAKADNSLARWGSVSTGWQTFVLLNKQSDVKQLSARLPEFARKYIKDNSIATGKTSFSFQPLSEIHYSGDYGAYGHQVSASELLALAVIGVFILLLACINFINMATAQAVSRAREIGIRKVLGSRRWGLMVQFIGETMLVTALAMFLACIFTEMSLPWMKTLLDQPITFNVMEYPVILLFMVSIVLITGFLSGLYPALIMSGYDPVVALKSKMGNKSSGKNNLRQALVIIQFTITLVLITGTLIISQQMDFFRNKPLGFDHAAIALVKLPQDSAGVAKYQTFQNILSHIPGITHVSFYYNPPSSDNYDLNNVISYDNHKITSSFQTVCNFADSGFLSTFGLHLIAGRGLMASDTMKEVIVNETLLRKLGVLHPEDAIGKRIGIFGKELPIAGVVKDFINRSLADKIDPLLITTKKTSYDNVAFKLRPQDVQKTLKAVAAQFNAIFPENIYNADFYDKDIADYYINEARLEKLFRTFSLIVLLISAIGLLSLLSFITAQQTREIAVRKVLGASRKNILELIGKRFVIMIIVANVIACPIAYILAKKWLNGFAYRIEMPWIPFIMAAIISLLLLTVTVGWQGLLANGKSITNALKYE